MSRSFLSHKVRLLLSVLAALVLCASSAGAQVVLSGSAFGSGGVLTGGGLRLIESFAAGPLVPGLIGLADLKGDYVEVGGTTLGGETGGGNGLLGTLSFEALQGFEGETRLRIPFVIWDRGTGGRQTVRADVQAALTSAGGLPSPDFDGDGVVGFEDFFLFANVFGSSDAKFDLDGDGNVGFTDFFLFADAFGKKVG